MTTVVLIFLPYLVGAAKARQLCFSAIIINGHEACNIGLVTKVAGADTFEREDNTYANHLAQLPTVAIGYMKKNLNTSQQGSLSDVLDL